LLLVVPSGDEIREALGELHEVTQVRSALEATALLRKDTGFDVVITEAALGTTNGAEFLRKVLAENKCTLGILVASYSEYLKIRDKSGDDPFLILIRPYQTHQLIDTVRRAVKFAQLRREMAGLASARKAMP
jgi:DNA-binding NtrC family response regulator